MNLFLTSSRSLFSMSIKLIINKVSEIERKYELQRKFQKKSSEETYKFKKDMSDKMIEVKREFNKKEIESTIEASKTIVS